MNPLVLYLASGESLYLGAALLLLLVLLSFYSISRVAMSLQRRLIWVALALMIMGSPPFLWLLDIVFAAVFLLWFISNRKRDWEISRPLRITSACALIIVLIGLTFGELYHRRLSVVRATSSDHVVVLGDSISAGLGGRVRPWPELMQEISGMQVKNLSKAGATLKDGAAMAKQVVPQDRLVLIELGGNDLIAGEPYGSFARSLESVLQRLAEQGRTVIMFELPLLPEMIPYGQAQRRLSKKYGVVLIPKRFLAGVLSGGDATSDGLHLTEVGARRMALLVSRVLTLGVKSS